MSIAARANNPCADLRDPLTHQRPRTRLRHRQIEPNYRGCSIVKRCIFSHDIIGTDHLSITSVTGNKERKVAMFSFEEGDASDIRFNSQ